MCEKIDNSVKYPCYDCGSTIKGHHTPKCEMSWPNDIKDLPMKGNTQYWDREKTNIVFD